MPPPVEDLPGRRIGISFTVWLIIVNVVVFVVSYIVEPIQNPPVNVWWDCHLNLWPNFGEPVYHPVL